MATSQDTAKVAVITGASSGIGASTARALAAAGYTVVLIARRADRIKILVWDASGLVLVWKQLEGNVFRWPPIVNGVMRLSPVEFAALFDGFDWSRMQTPKRIPRPTAAA